MRVFWRFGACIDGKANQNHKTFPTMLESAKNIIILILLVVTFWKSIKILQIVLVKKH